MGVAVGLLSAVQSLWQQPALRQQPALWQHLHCGKHLHCAAQGLSTSCCIGMRMHTHRTHNAHARSCTHAVGYVHHSAAFQGADSC